MFRYLVLLALLAAVSAFTFTTPAVTRAPRLSMMFNFGSKKPAQPEYKVGQGTANKGTYVPDGLTPEQYSKFLAAEAAKKASVKTKFPKGKVTESLTEWMDKNEKKGLKGLDLLKSGHRMVKTKYDEWYTDESPV